MKASLFTLLLFFQFTIVFGQSSDGWGPWTTDPCFKGIKISVKNLGYDKSTKSYWWNVRFKNNYNRLVHFNFRFEIDGESAINGLWSLNAGTMQTFTSVPYKSDKAVGKSFVTNVCFNENYMMCGSRSTSETCYAECDNGIPNIPNDCGAGNTTSSNKSTDQNAPGGSISEINEEIKELQRRQSIACGKLQQQGQPFNARLCTEGFNGALPQNDAETKKWLLQLRSQVNELEIITKSNTQKTEQESEAARLKKEAEEKAEKFNQYMADGRTALGNEEFDNAISNYNTAKNYASTSQQTDEANRAIAEAEKAKVDAASKKRIEAQKKRDDQEDAAYTASVASTTGLMLLLKDRYPANGAYCRLQAGLGMEEVPLMVNIARWSNSESGTNLLPTVHLGLKFGFFHKKPISWHFNPIFSYGINAFSEGTSGSNIDYGGTSYITLSPKSKSIIKLFAEAGYIGRSGNYTFDLDASSGGSSATDRIEKGAYNFHFIRMGGGIVLHFIHHSKETYIKPGLFFDKMSFAQKGDKPSMLFNIQVNIESVIILEFNYSKNYAIPGKADYPLYVVPENQNYWNFKIIRQGAF